MRSSGLSSVGPNLPFPVLGCATPPGASATPSSRINRIDLYELSGYLRSQITRISACELIVRRDPITAPPVPSAGRGAAPAPARARRVALALLAAAQLMLILDVTVVNVALPDIGAALRLTQGELPWVMTAYTVCFGGLMLLGGRIADRYGARRVTLAGLAVFTGASLLSGLAAGPSWLLAGRALQGIGAALLSPAALATVMMLFTGRDRPRALAVWSSLAGLGAALGVILGGVLTSEAGWRWIFAVNVPIGVALLIALPLIVPADGGPADSVPVGGVPAGEVPAGGAGGSSAGPAAAGLDVPGALLVTAGTGAA